jgi:glycosyltransferase involved in cell wall biosynthesis
MRVVVSVGGTWHVPYLGYQLQKRDMLQGVFTTTPKKRFLYRANLDSKRIHWFPLPELFSERLASLLKIPPMVYAGSPYWHAVTFDQYVLRQLRSLHPDLLVAFSRFGLDSFRVCQLEGIKTIVERDSTHTIYRERLLEEEYSLQGIEKQWRPLDRRVVERELFEYDIANYIQIPSVFVENSFVEMGVSKQKIVRIPMGVNLEWFHPVATNEPRPFKVLSIGGLGVRKGTKYLLESVEMLAGLNVDLVLAGALDPFIAQQLQTSKAAWTFTGYVQHHRLPGVYNNASVYCLPSVEEAMSYTILEAMACGLPVIASVNTGAADIITDGVDGFLVPIRDAEAIAEKLAILHDNPELRREMGIKARERAATLSWDQYGESISQEYRRIVT